MLLITAPAANEGLANFQAKGCRAEMTLRGMSKEGR